MPKDTQRTSELLEELLSGRQMTSGELNGLLQDRIDEDLHLDYKHGDALQDRREANQMLREYVSGFANSAGGMLIVGVDEANWRVTGCQAPGGGSLTRWASRSLTPIAGYLSPPPILQEVDHPDGPVLVAVVTRSAVLAPCFERGDRRSLYYLRLDDQTLQADEYLVADLVLGRRQHAYLTITEVMTWGGGKEINREAHHDWWFQMQFTIENQGLSRAENVRVGVINLSGRNASSSIPMGNHLLGYVAVVEPDKYRGDVLELRQHVNVCPVLEPFALRTLSTSGCVSSPLAWAGGFYTPYEWKAAVYLIAEGTPPTWYQLSITIDTPLLTHLQSSQMVSSTGPFLRIERLATGRPVVGWVGDNI